MAVQRSTKLSTHVDFSAAVASDPSVDSAHQARVQMLLESPEREASDMEPNKRAMAWPHGSTPSDDLL